MLQDQYDLIVIGGGAAGMMAAVTASEFGSAVLLLEKNESVGKKLLITGKGRCNLTNECDNNTLIANLTANGRFLYSTFNRFSAQDTMHWFEDAGVPLKTERGNRVFPQSDRAGDIVRALKERMKQSGVQVRQETVKEIATEQGAIQGVCCESGNFFHTSSVLVATGGMSYPQTGSTGDGYRLAKAFGHRIVEPKPSLIPVVAEEDWCKKAMGLSLKNVTLTLKDTETKHNLFEELGEMLFTHFGVSGPLVLSASAHMRPMRPGRYQLLIDLKPGLSEEQLDQRVLRDFTDQSNKDFANALGKLLPRKIIPIVIRLSEIPIDCKVNQITREMRQKLCFVIKHLTLTAKEFRPIKEAIITSGGVHVDEVSPKTMESKLQPGLFFAGEVLDLDAYTGGFNLQIAFSTGYAAGLAAIGQLW